MYYVRCITSVVVLLWLYNNTITTTGQVIFIILSIKIFFKYLLTTFLVTAMLVFDKRSCQNDKKNGHDVFTVII